MKFVIRAGGIGTRLWPYSRKALPKQFHALVGERSMLQEAVDRVRPIARPDDIYVSTGAGLVDTVRGQLPDLPEERIIPEPALRNTAPAIGLECILLESRYPGCTVASLGSDHHIRDAAGFCRLLRAAEALVARMPQALVTLGVKPTRAETGFGYIKVGPELATEAGLTAFQVDRFLEKPDADTARRFLEDGGYLWNSNMFVWKARTVLDLLARFEPDLYRRLDAIRAALGTPGQQDAVARHYPGMPSVAIDNAVVERADTVATFVTEIGWSDIGSWQALGDAMPPDRNGNLLSGEILNLGSRNATVFGRPGRLVALVDLDDIVVVDTEDALLVCRRSSAQRIKDVVARLEQDPRWSGYT